MDGPRSKWAAQTEVSMSLDKKRRHDILRWKEVRRVWEEIRERTGIEYGQTIMYKILNKLTKLFL